MQRFRNRSTTRNKKGFVVALHPLNLLLLLLLLLLTNPQQHYYTVSALPDTSPTTTTTTTTLISPTLLQQKIIRTMFQSGFKARNMAKKMSNMIVPSGDENDKNQKSSVLVFIKASIVYLISVGAVVASIATMELTQGFIVDLASIFCLVIAPFVAFQNCQLHQLGGLRSQQNRLRSTVYDATLEREALSSQIVDLEKMKKDMRKVERSWNKTFQNGAADVERITNIIKERDELQQKIKKTLEGSVLQEVLSAVLLSDRNEDNILSRQEVLRLEHRLEVIEGIRFDRANFRKKVGGRELTIAKMMDVIRNLMDDSVPERKNVFHLEPQQILKSSSSS